MTKLLISLLVFSYFGIITGLYGYCGASKIRSNVIVFSSTPSYESMLQRAQGMKQLKLAQQPPVVAPKDNYPKKTKSWTPSNAKQTVAPVVAIVAEESLEIEQAAVEPSNNQDGSPAPWTYSKPQESLTAREKASFKNKVPFDTSTYEVLKTAIELVSKRINEPEALSVEVEDSGCRLPIIH
mmetsp:Transcript_7958/g.11023  ORF Transcript_7958/g.11023 Transcript_7958/m.11023 type:complete len:182 (+) Transcript_7958:3-548(+)